MPEPAESFVEAVLAVVADIPPGKVMTYGGVAAVLGSRAARVVGQVMAYYGEDVPWWRVIRAGGHPPAGHEELALAHYAAEGTPLIWPARSTPASAHGLTAEQVSRADRIEDYRVDLRLARWSP
jgi:alkylated DNA nucleotide flippase Atl1